MVQPIDYGGAFAQQTPTQAIAQGYQLGAGIRDDMQQQRAMQAQADAARQQQQAIRGLLMNPRANADDYAAATLLFPGMKDQVKQAWEIKNPAQQESMARDNGQVFAALQAGKPEIAMQFLQRRADAMENAGADPREIQQLRTQAQIIEADPNYARSSIGMFLSGTDAGRKVLTAAQGVGKEEREQAQAPAELLKKQADASEAATKAGFAPQKFAADIGLTQAQTKQALAQTEKLGAEVQKAALEAAGGGGLDPEKKFDFESKLRKEYSTQTANFQDVKESYGRIKSAENTGAGDIALVYAYMKMLDPGSVVREGEFATASNSAGVPAAIQNLYNKAINGERLTEGQRKTFAGQAAKLLTAAEKREKEVRGGVEQVVKSYKLNPDNVFYTPSADAAAPGAAPAAGGAPAASGALPASLAGKGWAKY